MRGRTDEPEPREPRRESPEGGSGGGGKGDDAGSPPRMVDLKWAITGGIVATAVALGGMTAVGSVGSYEARQLLEATVPAIRFLCSSTVTAAATVLALMLTLLSLSHAHDTEFKESHYVRIQQISWMAAATIVAATLLLLLLSIPLEESPDVRQYYEWIYYAILVSSAALGGMLVTVILMLYHAISGLVSLFRHTGDSPLVRTE